MTSYDPAFFSGHQDESSRSAQAFAAVAVAALSPGSVIDVGCGIGTWLCAFADLGVPTLVGVDGDYVRPGQLLIPAGQFVPHDLTQPLHLPDRFPEQFDLAVSMEVAEHLPEEHAAAFVQTLTSLAPVVMFSAAIPHQGGTDHVNEQWQTYWAVRFAEQGYAAVDYLRPRLWNAPEVAFYYAQNALLYVRHDRLEDLPDLVPYVVAADTGALSKVHPRLWEEVGDPQRVRLKRVLAALPYSLRNALARRLGFSVPQS